MPDDSKSGCVPVEVGAKCEVLMPLLLLRTSEEVEAPALLEVVLDTESRLDE